MSDKTREAEKARLTTVLDPLRPGMVVRRRVVYETPAVDQARAYTTTSEGPKAFPELPAISDGRPARPSEEDEDQGPPSSINVARALASLRADELARVEDLVRADDDDDGDDLDDDEPASDVAPVIAAPLERDPEVHEPTMEVPTAPTILVGREIALAELAKRLEMAPGDLTATLVARGFYSLTPKTVLSRETARSIAASFGWMVADGPDEPTPRPKKVRAEGSPSKPPPAPPSKPRSSKPRPSTKKKKV